MAESPITAADFDAVLFDLDGVLTDTARVHARAWKDMFDAFLQARTGAGVEPQAPFDDDRDYKRYVDGKPRYDGVRSFLASRGIELPEGVPAGPVEEDTVRSLGDRKAASVLALLARDGVERYPGSFKLLERVRAQGLKTAVVSASKNCLAVLEAAELADRFDARVDGMVADALGLPGKPDPAPFLEAARQLGVAPARAVVIEDAIAGVQSGCAGGFGLVVGVDRGGNEAGLRDAGAQLVVTDLGELA